jgi:hypothetical protein
MGKVPIAALNPSTIQTDAIAYCLLTASNLTIHFQDVLAAQQVIQLLFIGNVLNLVFHGIVGA